MKSNFGKAPLFTESENFEKLLVSCILKKSPTLPNWNEWIWNKKSIPLVTPKNYPYVNTSIFFNFNFFQFFLYQYGPEQKLKEKLKLKLCSCAYMSKGPFCLFHSHFLKFQCRWLRASTGTENIEKCSVSHIWGMIWPPK